MKTLKESLNDIVTVYWWNMGRKTLEFTGTYADYFKIKDIGVKLSKGTGRNNMDVLKSWVRVGSSEITVKQLHTPGKSNYSASFDTIIKMFLVEMGDKAEMTGMYSRTTKINWR